MGNVTLTASDGFELGAYEAAPQGNPRGAIVVIQEIFGVNQHIRDVADDYANEGYVAIAPALFDRIERDVELGYDTEEQWAKGMALAFEKFNLEEGLKDIQAAVDAASSYGKVGLVGYCFGGNLAWVAACEVTGLSAASSYYGGFIGKEAGRTPRCPVSMHFGEKDEHIPESEIDLIREAHPSVVINMYDADHGFNCNHRESYDATSAAAARKRTLDLFGKHL